MFYVADSNIYSTEQHLLSAGKDPATSATFATYFEAEHYAHSGQTPSKSQRAYVAGTGASARVFDTREAAERFAPHDTVIDCASQGEAALYAVALSQESPPPPPRVHNVLALPIAHVAPACAHRRHILSAIDAALAGWKPCELVKDALTFAPAKAPRPRVCALVRDADAAPKAEGTLEPDAKKMKVEPLAAGEKKALPVPEVSSEATKALFAGSAAWEAALEAFRSSRPSLGSGGGKGKREAAAAGSSFLAEKKKLVALLRSPPPAEDVVADPYQTAAIQAALDGKSFLLTGSAGTGKSFVLKRIIKALRAKGRRVAVTASTGCAAVSIQGNTIHSVSGVGTGMDPIGTLVGKASKDMKRMKRFRDLDTLVIDEISMIDSFLFEKIEKVIAVSRKHGMMMGSSDSWSSVKKKRKSKDEGDFSVLPFGGIQVIVCGDFFQLPPVGASDHTYRDSKEKFFAFESSAWRKAIKSTFLLRVVHRQSDHKFAGLLNEIRQGIVTDCSCRVLDASLINAYKRHVEADEDGKQIHFTKLYAYRNQVSTENNMQLRHISRQGVSYRARDSVNNDKLGTLTQSVALALLKNVNVEDVIEIKEGARVLCLKNIDPERGIVNGSAGDVIGYSLPEPMLVEKRAKKEGRLKPELEALEIAADDIREDEILSLDDPGLAGCLTGIPTDIGGFFQLDGKRVEVVPVVKFDNGVTRRMASEKWDVFGMDGEVIATRHQVPLILGWALSIHKSQGMTLEHVETDVARAFDYGQVYVALSRATSMQGLRLKSFNRHRVEAHPKVKEFYRNQRTET